jgi:hypothetical protein
MISNQNYIETQGFERQNPHGQSVLSNLLHSLSLHISRYFEKYNLMDGTIETRPLPYMISGVNIYLDYPSADTVSPEHYGYDTVDEFNNPIDPDTGVHLPASLVITINTVQVRKVTKVGFRMVVTVRFELLIPPQAQVMTGFPMTDFRSAVGAQPYERYTPLYLQLADNVMSAALQFPYYEFPIVNYPRVPREGEMPQNTPEDDKHLYYKGMILSTQPMELLCTPETTNIIATYEIGVKPIYTSAKKDDLQEAYIKSGMRSEEYEIKQDQNSKNTNTIKTIETFVANIEPYTGQ